MDINIIRTKIIWGFPIVIAYGPENGIFQHESGQQFEFSIVPVSHIVRWDGNTEILVLTSRNDEEAIMEIAWECYFKLGELMDLKNSYERLSESFYAASFCTTWKVIRNEFINNEQLISEESEIDSEYERPEEDWDWYNNEFYGYEP